MVALFLAMCVAIAPMAAADDAPRGVMFDNVVNVLRKGFYDEPTRNGQLPELAKRYRDEAHNAGTLDAERVVVERMLGEINASHLGLLSAAAHEQMMRNLTGQPAPTFGMELVCIDDKHFVVGVLEGGPADEAGVKRGDRVVLIDEVSPADSPRLDWRSDDAALPDPPMHALLAAEGDRIVLRIEREAGATSDIEVVARIDSAMAAAKRSAMVVEVDGRSVAYIHFWYVHTRGMDTLLARLAQNEFKDCEALVLDLRGRGGSAEMVTRVLRTLAGRNSKWRKPIVALIDANTRSAKEMLAYELKTRKLGTLVGERTAGALLPATFVEVGADSVLMYPAFALGRFSEAIEGKGVEPDVRVASPLPYSAGADPIRVEGLKQAAELAKQRALAKQPV